MKSITKTIPEIRKSGEMQALRQAIDSTLWSIKNVSDNIMTGSYYTRLGDSLDAAQQKINDARELLKVLHSLDGKSK